RTAFSSTKATPIEAMASAKGRRSRIGRNAIRSTASATTPPRTSAPSHASSIGRRAPRVRTRAREAPTGGDLAAGEVGKRRSPHSSENATAGSARMPPVTTPLKTYCAMGGMRAAGSGIDDGHWLELAAAHLLHAEGRGQDVADLVEVAGAGGPLVVDLLA